MAADLKYYSDAALTAEMQELTDWLRTAFTATVEEIQATQTRLFDINKEIVEREHLRRRLIPIRIYQSRGVLDKYSVEQLTAYLAWLATSNKLFGHLRNERLNSETARTKKEIGRRVTARRDKIKFAKRVLKKAKAWTTAEQMPTGKLDNILQLYKDLAAEARTALTYSHAYTPEYVNKAAVIEEVACHRIAIIYSHYRSSYGSPESCER